MQKDDTVYHEWNIQRFKNKRQHTHTHIHVKHQKMKDFTVTDIEQHGITDAK